MKGHRSGCVRVATSPWRPTCHRHHTPMCNFCRLPPSRELCTNQRCSVETRKNKETKYAELVDNNHCHLVVVALETRGRWSVEAMEFIDMMAADRAREVLHFLSRSVHLAWRKRWTRMLAVSCARSFANSLVSSLDTWNGTDGATPDVADMCKDG